MYPTISPAASKHPSASALAITATRSTSLIFPRSTSLFSALEKSALEMYRRAAPSAPGASTKPQASHSCRRSSQRFWTRRTSKSTISRSK